MIDFEVDTFWVSKMVIAVHSISYYVINGVLIIQDTGHSPPTLFQKTILMTNSITKWKLLEITFSQTTLSFRLDFISLESDEDSSLSYSLNGGPFGEYNEPIAIKDDTSLTIKTKEQGQPSFFLSSKVTVTINEAP